MNLTLPDQPELLANVGSACRISNQFDAAAQCLNRSLQLNLARAETWNNRGQLHEDLGEFGEAYTAYQNAYSLNRTHPVIALSLAYQRMRAGEWSNGPWLPAGAPEGTTPFPGTWDLWEQGRNNYGTLPDVPIWKGQNLIGDRLLIVPEGGFGDYVWLSRYFDKLGEMVRSRGAIWIIVPDSLCRLARTRFPFFWDRPGWVVPVSEAQDRIWRVDYQVPLLSLLTRFLRPTREIPPAVLHGIPAESTRRGFSGPRIDRSGSLDATGTPDTANDSRPLSVGICAFAQENGVQRPHRSIPSMSLAPLREIPGVEWFSLMPDRRLEWMVGLSPDCGGRPRDWEDTAQVIEHLDLVVTVDTAVAHLAASLGVPTWILLPMRADWKYHKSLCLNYIATDLEPWESSIWYPKVSRLFRQRDPISWDGVISEVCAELKVLLQAQELSAEIR